MSKIIKGIIVTLLLVVLLILFLPTSRENPESLFTDETMVFVDENGEEYMLGSLLGDKFIVVNMWASWCPSCITELPNFVELQKSFQDDILVVGISRDRSISTAVQYANDLEINNDEIVLWFDPEDKMYKKIGSSMPETLFVRPDGTVHFHKRGIMSFNEMVERTNNLIGN